MKKSDIIRIFHLYIPNGHYMKNIEAAIDFLIDELEQEQLKSANLENLIKEAKTLLWSDGPDGEVLSKLIEIL